MMQRRFKLPAPFCFQPSRNGLGWGRGGSPPWRATSRLVVALLAVASGVACGGGGTANVTPPPPAQPSAQVSSTSLTFSGQNLGTASANQSVTLSNSGNALLLIASIAASNNFEQVNNCNGSMGASGSCTIQVSFAPTAAGPATGTLTITDNSNWVAGSMQTVNLQGTGNSPLTGVFTQRYDNARSGENTQEVLLTPSNVNENQFGKLFSLPVDGQVYAQPLFMENVAIPSQGTHNVVFVATQHNSVYAFDADSPSTNPLWHTSFLNPAAGVTTVPASAAYPDGNEDINPEVGITSTPVIDPVGGTIYVTAKTQEPLNSSPSCSVSGNFDYCYRLHALDITTGAEKLGGPVLISASVAGTGYDNVGGTVTFRALRQLQRPGLLLLNGTLYMGFGSHGDVDYYHGWLMAYDATTLKQLAVFNTTPNARRGSIWAAGGGVPADANGNLYVDYGDSVLRMQLQSGQLKVLDYFTPFDQAALDAEDLDLGSSPALILPDQSGPYPHLLAMGGKDGRIWLLNRDNLGSFTSGDTGAAQLIPGTYTSPLFGGGAYWNGNLYFHEVADNLNQFPLQNGRAQTPTPSESEFGGFPNSPPAVSAHGTSNGVLWLIHFRISGQPCPAGSAVLYAFDATNVASHLYNSCGSTNYQRDQAGAAVKFAVPTIVNGKVYMGTASEVDVFGLLP